MNLGFPSSEFRIIVELPPIPGLNDIVLGLLVTQVLL